MKKRLLALILAVITVFSLVCSVSAAPAEEGKVTYSITVDGKAPSSSYWGIVMGDHTGQYTILKSDSKGYFKVVNEKGQWCNYRGEHITHEDFAIPFNGFMFDATGKPTANASNYSNECYIFLVLEDGNNLQAFETGTAKISSIVGGKETRENDKTAKRYIGSICGFKNTNIIEFMTSKCYDLNTAKLVVNVNLSENTVITDDKPVDDKPGDDKPGDDKPGDDKPGDDKTKLPFTDVHENDWFYKGVAFVFDKGYMNGTSKTTFAPNAEMTRAQAAMILMNMSNGEPGTKADIKFKDVAADAWYVGAVAWAYKNSMMTGTSETTFEPEARLTREQFVVVMYRFQKASADASGSANPAQNFPDWNKVSNWATQAMAWAVEKGLIAGTEKNGKVVLAPQDTITRAQVATILSR